MSPPVARVDEAFATVPRTGFLPPDQQRFAGSNTALSIGYGATNSQPSTVRAMLGLLDVRPGSRVLDVGAGSGWTTALLAHLCGRSGSVVGVERIPEVLAMGRANLAATGTAAPVELHPAAPGVLGWPAAAPYDRILVSAGAETVPERLVEQLVAGGVMVVPVAGVMLRVTRTDDEVVVERHGRYVFVPLIED